MAETKWGASSGELRLGIEVRQTPATVTADTKQVTLEVIYYAQATGYGHDFRGATVTLSGQISGSVSYDFYSAWNSWQWKELARRTITVPTKVGETVWCRFDAVSSRIWNGGAPSVSYWYAVKPIPMSWPNTPTNVNAVFTDPGMRVTWQLTPTKERPVNRVTVDRYTIKDTAGTRLSTLNGAATSWVDTAVPVNERIEYRVRAWNSIEASYAGKSAYVYSRPAAPVNVHAARVGNSVEVTWTPSTPYSAAHRVYDGETLLAELPGGTNTYRHTPADKAGTHTYTLKAVSPTGLVSAAATSNSVSFLSPPQAPDGLSPSTARVGQVRLVWTHNPTDGSHQRAYRIEWRNKGETSWRVIEVETATQAHEMAFTEPASIEWRVYTKGDASEGPTGGWSPASFTMRTTVARPPVLVRTAPATPGVWESPYVAIMLAYSQPDNVPMLRARNTLVDAVTGKAIEFQPGLTPQFQTPLDDGQKIRVISVAVSRDEIDSDPVTTDLTIRYPQPPTPVISPVWDETAGAVIVQITNPSPVPPQPTATANRVWHSLDDGQTWHLLAENLPPNGAITDHIAPSRGKILYRVQASSALPSFVTTQVEYSSNSATAWLSGGPGYSTIAPLRYDPRRTETIGLTNRKVHRFADRPLGVETSSTHISRKISFTASLTDMDQTVLAALNALAVMAGPHLWRDPTGLYMYASLSDVDLSRNLNGEWSVSFDLEEVEMP